MHIQDILAVIKYEDLQNIVLIGHSYGGMVATGVADRARDKIAQLIYLDAFVPRDGEALFDLISPEAQQGMRDGAKAGDGWRVPSLQIPSRHLGSGPAMAGRTSSAAVNQMF
jgi:pimeloyl-ACP methyl ester carboxylesterase